jgi:hypothetical protein
LAVDDLQSLSSTQLTNLSGPQLNALSTAQLSVLLTSQLASLTPSQISTLNTVNLKSLTTSQFQALTSQQIAGLTTRQVSNLETEDLLSLSSTQLRAMTVLGIGALRTEQIAALTTQLITYLSNTQIPGLSSTNLNLLSTTQLKSLTTSQIANLSTRQIANMSTSALSALTSSQVLSLTAMQIRALGAKVSVVGSATPVVLDLNGDGIKTLSIEEGVQFDILANGQMTQTGWISPNDGLLVMDRNGDQIINDGSELFGSSTVLSDGSPSPDGFAALGELDSTHDGVINQSDISFGKLRVWVDSNSDGQSTANEIKTLDELGIRQLNLNTTPNDLRDQGNLVGLTSTFETTDGLTHISADVWFSIEKPNDKGNKNNALDDVVQKYGLNSQVAQLSQAIASFAAESNLTTSYTADTNSLEVLRYSSSIAMLPISAMVAEVQRVKNMEQAGHSALPLAHNFKNAYDEEVTQSLACFNGPMFRA